MRKLSRAVLVIVASISLVALLFYRHEYNRLRFVLEAFSYFGHPGEKPLQVNCTGLLIASDNDTKLEHANYHFDEPTPSWQRLNDDAYIYSAYAVNDREIRAMGFARVKKIKLFVCEIYYENELEPTVGDFSYKIITLSSSIDKNSGDGAKKGIYNAYHFICTPKSDVQEKRIAGVSFANQRQLFPESVVLPVKTFDNSAKDINEIAVCVAPPVSRAILKSDMIDFISFHHEIGIRHFVVYDFGLPQRFNGIFKKITRKLNSELTFSYATVPWNFPFNGVPHDIIRRVIKEDCRYRTYKNVGFVVTLTWDEFFVMKYHRTVAKLFRDFKESGFEADRFRILTRRFCGERKELGSGNTSELIVFGSEVNADRPVFLYKSKANEPIVDDADVEPMSTRLTSHIVSEDVIFIYVYERHCNRSAKLTPQDDPYIGKFAKNIQDSPIYKLFQVYAL